MSELLGPTAGDVAVQRDTTDGTPSAEPMDTSTATGNTMSIPDLKLSVPVESVQTVAQRADRGASGGGSRERATSGEVAVTFRSEHLSPALFAAVAQGQQFAVVTITMGSTTLTLHGVVISSAKTGGESASLTLNFSSRELTSGAGGG